eukprot:6201481-Pleurochrysis_carterae.AAC.2
MSAHDRGRRRLPARTRTDPAIRACSFAHRSAHETMETPNYPGRPCTSAHHTTQSPRTSSQLRQGVLRRRNCTSARPFFRVLHGTPGCHFRHPVFPSRTRAGESNDPQAASCIEARGAQAEQRKSCRPARNSHLACVRVSPDPALAAPSLASVCAARVQVMAYFQAANVVVFVSLLLLMTMHTWRPGDHSKAQLGMGKGIVLLGMYVLVTSSYAIHLFVKGV